MIVKHEASGSWQMALSSHFGEGVITFTAVSGPHCGRVVGSFVSYKYRYRTSTQSVCTHPQI